MRFCELCGSAFQSLRTCPRDGVPNRADIEDPLVGQVIGDRYRILDRMAAGGMGQVYRAAHVRIASLFAVKVLYGDLAHDPQMRTRFEREAEAASCLSSRYIVRVVDFGESATGITYLTMELADGVTLGSRLSERPVLEEGQAILIARQVARGLAHAHERGIVHRDLKPDNVMLVQEDEEEVAKLLDFGLAYVRADTRLTTVGQIFGTPEYMAPEQFRTASADARADLYALGVMLYEMLAGRPPFLGGNLTELAAMHLTVPPPPVRAAHPAATCSLGLDAVISRLMAKSPEDRYPSARAVLDALRPFGHAAPARSVATPSARRRTAVPEGVKERIEAAIRDGAPMYNQGDHAGCFGLYWKVAGELLSTVLSGGHTAASARLNVAGRRASAAATPSQGAWEMRYAFDDLLHAVSLRHPPEGAGRIATEIALAELIAAPRVAAGHLDLAGDYYLEVTRALAAEARKDGAQRATAEHLDRTLEAATQLGGGQRSLAFLREHLAGLGGSLPTLRSSSGGPGVR